MKIDQLLTEAGGAIVYWYDSHENILYEFDGFHETYAKKNFDRMKRYEGEFDGSVYAQAFVSGYVRVFYEDDRFILNVEGYEDLCKKFFAYWKKKMLKDNPVDRIYADYFMGHHQGYNKDHAETPRDVRRMLNAS